METLFEGKKLYAVIIAFLLIITFFITFHLIRNHYKYVFKDVITENTLTAKLLSSLMYEHQKAATSILESYARRPLFIDAVKKKGFHRALSHLKSLNEHHSEMDALFITDQYGTVWANYPVSKESYGKNLAYRDWYKGVSKKWRPYISTVFRLIVLEKGLAVAVSVPVFDRKGKVIGIFGSTQRISFFATLIRENTLYPRKSITLLDQEGNIIFSNALPYQEKITKYPDVHVLEKALAGVIIDMEIADAKEKGSISYVSIGPVRGIGWSVIVGQEKDAILKQLYWYFIRSAVTGFVIFLSLTVCLLYFRREYKYRKTKELLQAEEKYRSIFNDSILGIYQTTPEGRVLSANPALARMNGYDTPEELINSITDLATQSYVNPEDREIFKRNLSRKGVVERFEARLRKKGGETIWVSINAHTVKDTQGKISRYEGTIEDITERKRAEEMLHRAEENFRRSLEDSPLGVRIVTIEGETIYANRAILDIYGYDSVEELRTTPIKNRYTPQSYAEFKIRREKRKGDDGPSEYEISIVRENGEVRHLQVFRKEILWNDERQFQIIYQDITERKQMEKDIIKTVQQLQETRDMLIQFEKEAALGRLVIGLAHEVLNPVSIISSRLQFMEDETLSDEARESVRICLEQLQRITKISQDLHQSAAKQPGMLIGGDLRRVIEAGLQLTERRRKEDHVQVEYDPPSEVIPVKMERDKLVKVMVNLILNACDAMTGKQPKRLIITVHRPEDSSKDYSIFLTVADNGEGIPTGNMSWIFEPFFTTKEPGKGTGLGLSVCKGIIQEHGGMIHVEKNDLGGVSFIVELPLDHP